MMNLTAVSREFLQKVRLSLGASVVAGGEVGITEDSYKCSAEVIDSCWCCRTFFGVRDHCLCCFI